MLTPCRLVYPYFDNPSMLEHQVENWSRFEGELRDAIRIIVVDDHSSKPALPIIEKCKAPCHVFRLNHRIPWNNHQCRNIGAKEAGPNNTWMFMSDIDIVLTPEMAYTMLSQPLDAKKYYTFERTFAPDCEFRKTHVNTFLVKRGAFWQVNGYDLDLTPVGGGGYGGDNQFIRQLRGVVQEEHRDDVVLIGFGRSERDGEPVIKDADTTSLDRTEWHEKYKLALAAKKKSGDMRSINPIRTSYTRML